MKTTKGLSDKRESLEAGIREIAMKCVDQLRAMTNDECVLINEIRALIGTNERELQELPKMKLYIESEIRITEDLVKVEKRPMNEAEKTRYDEFKTELAVITKEISSHEANQKTYAADAEKQQKADEVAANKDSEGEPTEAQKLQWENQTDAEKLQMANKSDISKKTTTKDK